MKITIGYLYFDLLNLYGDSGNIKTLLYHLKEQGVKVDIKYISLGDKIDFDNAFVIAALEKVGIVKYIIIPIMIIINFVQLIIYSLLISLVGLLSNLIGNRKISYRELFNLSLYAVTLPAIINLIYPIGGYFILVGGIILMFGLSYIFLNNEKQNIESN